jgi:hypothetical protein
MICARLIERPGPFGSCTFAKNRYNASPGFAWLIAAA